MDLVRAQSDYARLLEGADMVLMRFTEIARMKNDTAFAERCQREAAQLRQHIERSGWDGERVARRPQASVGFQSSRNRISLFAFSVALVFGPGRTRCL